MSVINSVTGYLTLAERLRMEIEEGEHEPGARLPTEQRLSEIYDINRHTVRAAMQLLEHSGHIYRVRGKGTFVARRKISYAISPGTSFTTSIRRLGLGGDASLLRSAVGPADADTADRLGIEPREETVLLEIIRAIEGVPACVTTSHLPSERFPGLAEAAEQMSSLHALLRERYGVEGIRRVRSEIEARLPDDHDRERLEMPDTMPVLVVRSLNVDGEGRVIEYCVSRARSDAYVLHVDFPEEKA